MIIFFLNFNKMDNYVDELSKLIINNETTYDNVIFKIRDYINKNSKAQKYILYNCDYGGFSLDDEFCEFANCKRYDYHDGVDRLLFDGFKYTILGNKLIEFGKIKFDEIDNKNNYYILFNNLELFERVFDSDKIGLFIMFNNLYEIQKSGSSKESNYDKNNIKNDELVKRELYKIDFDECKKYYHQE